MNRRGFLQATSGALAGSLISPLSAASNADSVEQSHWSLGWQSALPQPLEPLRLDVSGKLPAEVTGSLYRNGPALTERAGIRYRHWFDGDGMIQRFRIEDQTIVHDAQYVQTEKFTREQRTRRFLLPGAGTDIESDVPSGNNDSGNVANIALLPWNSELLALWEGGSAYRVDPDTLETLGRKDWRDDLKHMPFSAHPMVEPDGTMWNFGSAPYAGRNGKLFVYRVSPESGMQAVQPVDLPMSGYIHSFTMSERYLVFYFGPHLFTPGATTFVDSFEWSGGESSKILLIDKNDLSAQQWFEAPPGFVFHCANAYEQGDEVIARLCLYDNADIMQRAMFELMRAEPSNTYPDYARAAFAELRLNRTTGTATVDTSDVLMEFPSVDPRAAFEAGSVFGVGHSDTGSARYSDSVVRMDVRNEETTRYVFDAHHIVEEPLWVAKSAGQGGWLVGTFLDYRRAQTGVYVLDAENLTAGPIAMGRMSRHVPLGFHGCFVGVA
ncbi:MAG: carotenoid oxygenase family protein [Pseudomonadota bacterium]